MTVEFRTFGEFLRAATTRPNLLRSPYTHEGHRILAYMEWHKGRLLQQAQAMDLTQSVAVIIPVHNGERTVGRALASVLTQTHWDLEVIVVDDASTDGTADAVERVADDRVKLISLATNVGHSEARNIGMRAARSDFISYLDADDWWDPCFVSISLAQMVSTGAKFVYSAQRVLRPPSEPSGDQIRGETILFSPYNRALLENRNYISMISVMHDRSAGLAVGFDPTMRRLADWDFFLRLSAQYPPVAIPVVLSTYDQADTGSVSRREDLESHVRRIRSTIGSRRLTAAGLQVPIGLSKQTRLKVLGASAGPGRPMKVAGPNPAAVRPVSIVIPSYEAAEYLRLCLESIFAFDDGLVHEVVIVDNGSSAGTRAVIAEYQERDVVKVIQNPTNRGFTYAAAQGMEAADPEADVVLLNNDAMVTPGWLDELVWVRNRYPQVGIVVPRQVLFAGEPTIHTHVPSADAQFECDTSLSAHHANVLDPEFDPRAGVMELSFAPFFCALITREAIEACGALDHVHSPHFQSDWTYCDAVRRNAGLKILYTGASKVYHFHSKASQELSQQDPAAFERLVVRNGRGPSLPASAESASAAGAQ